MTHKQRKFNIYSSIKRAIKNQWSVPLCSDGYLNYGTGEQLTSDNSGPNGFGNPNAWIVLSKTINNQQYQFCLQNDGYMGLRLKYSKLGFNNGVDNLQVTPSSQDQQVLLGGGTDAAPIYQQVVGGVLNFNSNSVLVKISTTTNELNFILNPKPAPVTNVPLPKPLPVINKVLT